MQKKYFIAALVLMGGLALQAVQNSSGPPLGYTGAPGEQNCSACHSGSAAVAATLTVLENNSPVTAYQPGKRYTVRLQTNSSTNRNGFQLTTSAGELIATSTANTQVQRRGEKQYIMHTSAGNRINEWTFDWQAPATAAGAITMYYSVLNANGNGSDSGDRPGTGSATLALSTTAVSSLVEANHVSVYPNPATNVLNIKFLDGNNTNATLTLMDAKGAVVLTQAINAAGSIAQVDVQALPAGIYTARISTDGGQWVQRISLR